MIALLVLLVLLDVVMIGDRGSGGTERRRKRSGETEGRGGMELRLAGGCRMVICVGCIRRGMRRRLELVGWLVGKFQGGWK